MKLCRCPVCHSEIHFDQLLEDDATRELLTLITELKHGVARPMVSYIALFRPEKSHLSNSRAVKLIQDVLAQFPASSLLAHALSETVNSVQKKRRESGKSVPLVNHNYLKQVIETHRVQFAGAASTSLNNAEKQAKREEDDEYGTILYIDRLHRMRQDVTQLKGYEIWKAWKEKQREN